MINKTKAFQNKINSIEKKLQRRINMYNPKLGLNLSSFRLNQRLLDIFLLLLHALGIIIVNEEQGQKEAKNRTAGTNVHNLEHK